MHDLLHTSTSCHFKICLKNHTTGITAQRDTTVAFLAQFYLTLCRRWNEGALNDSLPFSGEAHVTGGLSVTSLLQILEQCDLTESDICFVQIGENDVKTAKDDQLDLNNHESMHAPIDIVEEFHRQGVNKQTER